MKILGISAYYHDSAAVILEDSSIVAAAQEERFTRKKHDSRFPANATRFCLEQAGLSVSDLDAVVFYDKPLLKFERLLETYYVFSPYGVLSFITAIIIWIKEKLFLKNLLRKELRLLGEINFKKTKLLFPEHHLSHAASAFYASHFNRAAILTLDGVGEWATASIALGEGKNITILKELRFPHSIGFLYSAFTYYTGFKVNSGEYKLMGLAPYGDPLSPDVARYIELIQKELVEIKDDGSIWLNQKYFDYAVGFRMANDAEWERLFGFPVRRSESELLQCHCDMALAIQKVTEEVVVKMAREAQRLTGATSICLAGGVALNCVANGVLDRARIFQDIFIQPAAGDAGGALGAAYAANHIYFGCDRIVTGVMDEMNGAYLGPEFSDLDIERTARRYGAVYEKIEDMDDVYQKTAHVLAQGDVVGWFQGRMEFGPRALGNRSILGDPRNSEMQKKLNLKIKFREGFRPFAPSVMQEYASEYFEMKGSSPYMLLVYNVQQRLRNALVPGYHSLPLKDKLYFLRSTLPSITHIDYSARIQTVHRETNERYWKLIDRFRQLTGYGVVVNTSFNVRGEPIVCTPDDAYRCFMRTEMDYLVMGSYFFDKKKQEKREDDQRWKEEYVLD